MKSKEWSAEYFLSERENDLISLADLLYANGSFALGWIVYVVYLIPPKT